jgi:ankyrin repeat protein
MQCRHLLGKGQQAIMDEIANGMNRLALQNSKHARAFRRRLEDDVESVSAFSGRRVSLSLMTDVGLPLRKFLEAQDQNQASVLAPPTMSRPLSPPPGCYATQELPPQELPPLVQAAKAGNMQQVKALLSLGESPDLRLPDGRTALHFCVVYDDASTAEILIKSGANVNIRDGNQRSPLSLAINVESFGLAALLMRKGATVDSSVPVLLDAIRTSEGSAGVADFLGALRERLDDSEGPYLVHEAIDYETDETMAVLLSAGFDPNKRDRSGISPIHHAILRGRESAIKLLLLHGADENDYLPPETHDLLRPDVSWHRPLIEFIRVGITPLGTACAMYDSDIVRLLLKEGADPNFVVAGGM